MAQLTSEKAVAEAYAGELKTALEEAYEYIEQLEEERYGNGSVLLCFADLRCWPIDHLTFCMPSAVGPLTAGPLFESGVGVGSWFGAGCRYPLHWPHTSRRSGEKTLRADDD